MVKVGYTAAVITVSDKGYEGKRIDTSGEAIVEILGQEGWDIQYRNIIPDEFDLIKKELIKCSDELKISLICTTGGTGFSKRDITPEATIAVVDRLARGIPEAMRAESMRLTPKGMLSRAEAGIRADSLIINLPGSERAVRECLNIVIGPIKHGVEVLLGDTINCGRK